MTWNLARGEDFLPRTSLSELKRRMKAEHDAKPRMRLLIAMHRKQGKPLDEISEACGVARRTVHATLQRFQDRGVNAAYPAQKPGRPKRLTQKQLQDLSQRLFKGPQNNGFHETFWTSRMVLALVQREYGVQYTSEHMTRLLAKLGFSYKKPRATNPRRASDEEVAAFKKKFITRFWLPKEKTVSSSSKTRAHSR